jgi:hypothetical protein
MKHFIKCLNLAVILALMTTNYAQADEDSDGDGPHAIHSVSILTADEKGMTSVDSFNTKTNPPAKIYLKFQSDALTAGKKVKAEWVADDTHGVAPPHYLIDSAVIEVPKDLKVEDDKAFTITTSLSKPTAGWPAGNYSVLLWPEPRTEASEPLATVKFEMKSQ